MHWSFFSAGLWCCSLCGDDDAQGVWFRCFGLDNGGSRKPLSDHAACEGLSFVLLTPRVVLDGWRQRLVPLALPDVQQER